MADVKLERTTLDKAKPKEKDAVAVEAEVLPPKKVDTVAKAQVQKPSFGERFISTLGLESGRTVADVLMWDVVIPTTKDLIYNIFTQGMSVFLYGNAGKPRQGGGGRASTSRVSYGKYYDEPYHAQKRISGGGRPEPRKAAGLDFTQVRWYDYTDEDGHMVTARGQAQQVLDECLELVDVYGWCRVSDFLAAAGVPEEEVHFTDHALGWDHLGTAGPERCRDGSYYLAMPRPVKKD